uniref:Uncharacterized protein n=1 Tax=Arundo donax TaxID=35708 RepID=A0A0A9DL74_ARUDO
MYSMHFQSMKIWLDLVIVRMLAYQGVCLEDYVKEDTWSKQKSLCSAFLTCLLPLMRKP